MFVKILPVLHKILIVLFAWAFSCYPPPSFNSFSKLGDSGVWGLKKNFALLELLERLQNGLPGQCGAAEEAIGLSGEVQILKREKNFVTFA